MTDMTLQCERCGKGVQRGHRVSHAKNRTKRVFRPNLQTYRAKKGDSRVRMRLCSKCVRRVRKEETKMNEMNKINEKEEGSEKGRRERQGKND